MHTDIYSSVNNEIVPMLKFQRLEIKDDTGDEPRRRDLLSCLAVSEKLLAIGTHGGSVRVLDPLGSPVKTLSNIHSASVTHVAVDEDGESVASVSDDGRLLIHPLFSRDSKALLDVNYKRPLKGVALEPGVAIKKQNRGYIAGGMAGQVVSATRGWFGMTETVIYTEEDPVYTLSWKGTTIVWATDAGVRMHDTGAGQTFSCLPRPKDAPRADLFRCALSWASKDKLAIGWGNVIQMGTIKDRSKADTALGLSHRVFELTHEFQVPFIVSGLSCYGTEQILVLSYMADISEYQDVDVLSPSPNPEPDSLVPTSKHKKNTVEPPQMHITSMDGKFKSSCEVPLSEYLKLQARDMQLATLSSEILTDTCFYIMSPHDIILARPRTLDDRIDWLVSKDKVLEALEAAESDPGTSITHTERIHRVGQQAIQWAIDSKNYTLASVLCHRVFASKVELWEPWIPVFCALGHISLLVPHIPATAPNLLPLDVYDTILSYISESASKEGLVQALTLWSNALYNGDQLTLTLEDRIGKARKAEKENIHAMKEALLFLYESAKKYAKALKLGLELRKPGILSLIIEHYLYSELEKLAVEVLEYDAALGGFTDEFGNREGIALLINNGGRIPMERIVNILNHHPHHLHTYLDAIFQQDPQLGAPYHNRQVTLYAQYDPTQLLHFLKTSLNYNIPEAYTICEKKDLVSEMVYLLGKMGNNRKALMLIIERLGDVSGAIEFAKEQNDDELWEDLLKYSMDKPAFIIGLFENLGSFIDPLRVISRIPKGLTIPGLKASLLHVLRDLGTQISLREGCKEILFGDTLELLERLCKLQKQGLSVQEFPPCFLCANPINPKEDGSMLIFFCEHIFHDSCIESRKSNASSRTLPVAPRCPICSHSKLVDLPVSTKLDKKGKKKKNKTKN